MRDQLQPIFDLSLDWITYGNSNWIIYTNEEMYVWQGRFIAVIDTIEDACFLCEIANIESSGGWLPKWVWDWIRKDRSYLSPSNQLDYISLISKLPPPKSQS